MWEALHGPHQLGQRPLGPGAGHSPVSRIWGWTRVWAQLDVGMAGGPEPHGGNMCTDGSRF